MFESCRLHQIEPKPRKPVSCVDGFHPYVFHSCINDDKYTCPRCYTNGKQPLATTHETKNNKNNSMLCQSLISFLAYAGHNTHEFGFCFRFLLFFLSSGCTLKGRCCGWMLLSVSWLTRKSIQLQHQRRQSQPGQRCFIGFGLFQQK